MNYKNLLHFDNLITEQVSTVKSKMFIVNEVYELLLESYKDVKGGLNFINEDDLLLTTDKWTVIYQKSNIVGVIIYKAKKGLKMVALGIKKSAAKFAKKILSDILQCSFATTWMEVSEAVEKFILKLGGRKYFVPNKLAAKLTGKDILEQCEDGYHYKRLIKGIVKTKVIIGNAKYN